MADPFYPDAPEDLATRAQILSMSGLEFMKAMRDGKVASPAIARLMGIKVDLVEPGKVVFLGTPRFEHTNSTNSVHGGWYGTVLDSCMACAVMTAVPKGSFYTTLEYKVNITRPVPIGMPVHAVGVLQHAGRSTGIANGEVRGLADGKVYATGSTTCIIMKMT